MARRYFTPEEANALLAEVRLAGRIAGNGGDFDPQEPRTVEEELEREAQAVASSVERLEQLGVLVKDLDRGLVDFPALHGGEEVLLCWQVGEDEVAYWHGLDEGFAGRKPLPFE
jgi:hypothetical protein